MGPPKLLGVSSFGGPIAHIGYFREEFVVRRRWLDELFAEIPDMGDGPAKAAHAELAEGEEHFEGTGPPLLAHARGTRAELWRNAAAFRRSPAGRGRRRAVP